MKRKRLKQLQELTISEWRVLLLSMLLLPLIALVLKSIGFKKTQTFLSNHLPEKPKISIPEGKQLKEARSIARMVSVAANHGPYHANCLKQSLLIWWLLTRRGIPTEIKFGTQKTPEEAFGAHSWVEYNGEALSEPLEFCQQFLVFK